MITDSALIKGNAVPTNQVRYNGNLLRAGLAQW